MAPQREKSSSGAAASVERSGYYIRLTALWVIRLAAWVLGGYLIRQGFSMDSLKLYMASSVLLAIGFNVLPEVKAPPSAAVPASTRDDITHGWSSATSAARRMRGASSVSPALRTRTSKAPEAATTRDASTSADCRGASLVERARLEEMLRPLGTPGAMRCLTDEVFRTFMLRDGMDLPGDTRCPCGSGETFQRCCYAVPATVKDWADSIGLQ